MSQHGSTTPHRFRLDPKGKWILWTALIFKTKPWSIFFPYVNFSQFILSSFSLFIALFYKFYCFRENNSPKMNKLFTVYLQFCTDTNAVNLITWLLVDCFRSDKAISQFMSIVLRERHFPYSLSFPFVALDVEKDILDSFPTQIPIIVKGIFLRKLRIVNFLTTCLVFIEARL